MRSVTYTYILLFRVDAHLSGLTEEFRSFAIPVRG
jgi:hypothetical protein